MEITFEQDYLRELYYEWCDLRQTTPLPTTNREEVYSRGEHS